MGAFQIACEERISVQSNRSNLCSGLTIKIVVRISKTLNWVNLKYSVHPEDSPAAKYAWGGGGGQSDTCYPNCNLSS